MIGYGLRDWLRHCVPEAQQEAMRKLYDEAYKECAAPERLYFR